MNVTLVLLGAALLGVGVALVILHGISDSILVIERRLAEMERAGILIQPDGKRDQQLVMSRRAKLGLAEKFARQRAQGA